MKDIINKVQVNIPFWMLMEGYLSRFIDMGLNPEIGVDARSLETFSHDEFLHVGNRFRDRGHRITVHGPFMDLSPVSPDPAVRKISRQRFDQLFRVLPALSPISLVVHAGYDPRRHFSMKDQWLEESLEFFEGVAKRAGDLGCRLMIENVFEEHPDELLPLIRGLENVNAGLCIDVGHLNASCPEPLKLNLWLDTLGPYIGQFHLHDNRGDRDHHLPMGKGTVDFKPLFDFIKKTDPILTLEPHEEEDLYVSLEFLKTSGLA